MDYRRRIREILEEALGTNDNDASPDDLAAPGLVINGPVTIRSLTIRDAPRRETEAQRRKRMLANLPPVQMGRNRC